MTCLLFFILDFSTKLIGLTGTSQEIADVAKSYRVYYGFGDKDSDGDYIVSTNPTPHHYSLISHTNHDLPDLDLILNV